MTPFNPCILHTLSTSRMKRGRRRTYRCTGCGDNFYINKDGSLSLLEEDKKSEAKNLEKVK